MATIVTRAGKGSALSFTEMDANFSNLNTDKIENLNNENIEELNNVVITSVADNEVLAYDSGSGNWINQTAVEAGLAALTSFSVGAEGSASGDGSIAYDNGTGVFTYTPPTAAGIGAATSAQGALADSALQDVVDDLSPQLGGDLDVQANKITTSTSNGNLTLEANGTGTLVIGAGAGINVKAAGSIFTDTTNASIDFAANGTGYLNMNSITYFDAGIEEAINVSGTTTGTYAPAATAGSIHYVALTGNMTINGFTNPVAGQTISLFFDGTGGSYTLTLGASILTPGGSLALTDGGYDIVTITCLDDSTPIYIATAVNDFQ